MKIEQIGKGGKTKGQPQGMTDESFLEIQSQAEKLI